MQLLLAATTAGSKSRRDSKAYIRGVGLILLSLVLSRTPCKFTVMRRISPFTTLIPCLHDLTQNHSISFFSFLSHLRWIARHRKSEHGTRQSFTWRTSPTLHWKSTDGPRPRIGRWSELLFSAPLPRWTVDMKWFGVGLEERQGKWRLAYSSHFWCSECHAPTKSGWERMRVILVCS